MAVGLDRLDRRVRPEPAPDRFTPSITKARRNAPVATPLAWTDLAHEVRFDHFNVKTLPARLARQKRDPWARFFVVRQTITPAMMEQVGFAPGATSHGDARHLSHLGALPYVDLAPHGPPWTTRARRPLPPLP